MGHDGAGTAAHALAQWEEEEADGRVPLVGEKERGKGKRAATASVLGHRPAHVGRGEGEGDGLRYGPKGEGDGEEAQWHFFYFPSSFYFPYFLLSCLKWFEFKFKYNF